MPPPDLQDQQDDRPLGILIFAVDSKSHVDSGMRSVLHRHHAFVRFKDHIVALFRQRLLRRTFGRCMRLYAPAQLSNANHMCLDQLSGTKSVDGTYIGRPSASDTNQVKSRWQQQQHIYHGQGASCNCDNVRYRWYAFDLPGLPTVPMGSVPSSSLQYKSRRTIHT